MTANSQKLKNKHLKVNEVSLLMEVNNRRRLAPGLLKGG